MPTIYSYEALLSLTPPVFPTYDSEYVNIVGENFADGTFHSQGPRGGESFIEGDFLPGIPVVFDPDDERNLYYNSVEELFTQTPGTPWSAIGPRRYVRRFRVFLKQNTPHAGSVIACSCPGIPLPWAPYKPLRKAEWDYAAVAVDISGAPENEDDHQAWIVTVQYSTDVPGGGPTFKRTGLGNALGGNQNNPWEEPPTIEVDVETETVYPNQDLEGKSYNNSADQPLAFSHPTGYRSYTITRNESVFVFENRLEDYIYVVNSTPFKGYFPGYALCTGGRGVKMWRGMIPYYRVTYKVLCKKRVPLPGGGDKEFTPGWQPRILNAGMFQRDTLFGIVPIPDTLVPIIQFGHQVNQPVMLKADGTVQTEKFPNDYAIESLRGKLKPVWLDFTAFRQVELNDLLSF